MDKLYWIVCEEGETTLFEGRYLGRTRGAAMKFLKEKVNRRNLSGLVFTITELPIEVIREIVQDLLDGRNPMRGESIAEVPVPAQPQGRFDAYNEEPEPASPEGPEVPPPGDPRPSIDWEPIRQAYFSGLGPKALVEMFGISKSSLNKKITREGWASQRRQQ